MFFKVFRKNQQFHIAYSSGLSVHENKEETTYVDGWLDPLQDGNLTGVYNVFSITNDRKKITVSNDPLGQRPAYYFYNQNQIVFSSCFWKLQSTLDVNEKSGQVNLHGLYQLKKFRRLAPSSTTLHKNIFLLEAGVKLDFYFEKIKPKKTHTYSIQHFETNDITATEAARQLSEVLDKNISLIPDRFGTNSFYFGNSGGLDSRVIPAIANKHGLTAKGFLVSDMSGLIKNQSYVSAKRVQNILKFECSYFDFRENSSQFWERLIRDLLINPFGPANFHKNANFQLFKDSLVLNGGNSFLIANDNDSWKQYTNPGTDAINHYPKKILKRNFLNEGLNDISDQSYTSLVREELSETVDIQDPFSTCRALHQKLLNKTSPQGAFESMSRSGTFSYIYYPGTEEITKYWPKSLFFNRKVQTELFKNFFPKLLNIADQNNKISGYSSLRSRVLFKLRSNGLKYRTWVSETWYKELFMQVETKVKSLDSSLALEILLLNNHYNSAQDKMDNLKLALAIALIQKNISPLDLLSERGEN